MVAVDGMALAHADAALRADREVVLAAVAVDGAALAHADAALRADREVVLAAVGDSRGAALRLADDALRDDEQIVRAAVRHNGWALEHASPRLRAPAGRPLRGGWPRHGAQVRRRGTPRDDGVVADAVRSDGLALAHADEAPAAATRGTRSANGRALQYATAEDRRPRPRPRRGHAVGPGPPVRRPRAPRRPRGHRVRAAQDSPP